MQLNKKNGSQSQPIGVFDSGLGGLTVFKQIKNILPNESLIYFGDTARVPYGTKGKVTIQKFAKQITEYLYHRGVKMVVVACNTASSLALDYLRGSFDIPIVGVVEPAAREALKVTTNRRIGVIGTTATINSNKFQETLTGIDPKVEVVSQACPLFVPLIEEGWLDSPVTKEVAKIYLTPLLQKGIDTLILGCTHYPLISHVIKEVVGEKVRIVDTSLETALEVRTVLEKLNLLNSDNQRVSYEFILSDFPQRFEEIATRFLGSPLENVKQISLDECPE